MARLIIYGNRYEANVEQIPDDTDIKMFNLDNSFILDFLDGIEEQYIEEFNELPDDWFNTIFVKEATGKNREELSSLSDNINFNGLINN